jgi:hypothetical protein
MLLLLLLILVARDDDDTKKKRKPSSRSFCFIPSSQFFVTAAGGREKKFFLSLFSFSQTKQTPPPLFARIIFNAPKHTRRLPTIIPREDVGVVFEHSDCN